MKTIKIKICNYDPSDPLSYGKFLIERLERFYTVELSGDPDYVLFNEKTSEYLKYPRAIRIFYTGENIHPNWNLCDYAISFDRESFGGRNFRLPLYLVPSPYYLDMKAKGEDAGFEEVKPMTRDELAQKTGFCSFVYSNYLADPKRKELFDIISSYKKVSSGGQYINNVGGPVDSKLEFESKHKFSIAFENSSRDGYTTEKLPSALAARTIPIYFGNPSINLEFNTERFINLHDFPSFESALARVKEIDQNDDLYLSIVNQPVLAKDFHQQKILGALDDFLRSIFDQSVSDAKRRFINSAHAVLLENRERYFFAADKKISLLRKLTSPITSLPLIKRLKQSIRKKSVHSNH